MIPRRRGQLRSLSGVGVLRRSPGHPLQTGPGPPGTCLDKNRPSCHSIKQRNASTTPVHSSFPRRRRVVIRPGSRADYSPHWVRRSPARDVSRGCKSATRLPRGRFGRQNKIGTQVVSRLRIDSGSIGITVLAGRGFPSTALVRGVPIRLRCKTNCAASLPYGGRQHPSPARISSGVVFVGRFFCVGRQSKRPRPTSRVRQAPTAGCHSTNVVLGFVIAFIFRPK